MAAVEGRCEPLFPIFLQATKVPKGYPVTVEDITNKERAWKLAREVGTFLKQELGIPKVLVFGSLVESGGCRFDPDHSDVDIWFDAPPPKQVLHAIGACLRRFGEYDADGRLRLDIQAGCLCPSFAENLAECVEL